MALPQKLNWEMSSTTWASQLNPVIAFPPNQGILLTGIKLTSGVNNINHKLSRNQQGWTITDIDAVATVYRSQPFNSTTLTLTSNAACTVAIWVY